MVKIKNHKVEVSRFGLENRFQKYGTRRQRYASVDYQLIDNRPPITAKLDIKIDIKSPRGTNGVIPYEIIEVQSKKKVNIFKKRAYIYNRSRIHTICFKIFNLISIMKKLPNLDGDIKVLGGILVTLINELSSIKLTKDQGCILYALFNLTGGKTGVAEKVIFKTIKDYNPSISLVKFDYELKTLIELECIERKNGKIFLIEEITVRDSFKSYSPFAKKFFL